MVDNTVSKKHFKIERTKDGFNLIDLKSTNGTQLNGNRVEIARLKTNSLIKAGNTIVQFVILDGL